MKDRCKRTMSVAAVVAAMLLTVSCEDSTPPTEPPPGRPATQDPRIAGAWTGTYRNVSYECEALAEATFDENLGSVAGHVRVSSPCANGFFFQGTFQENTLAGVFVDAEGYNSSGRGTVSGATLEINIDAGWLGTIRMSLQR